MATRTKDHPTIPHTPVANVPAGTVVVVGTIVAVAPVFIAANKAGVLDPNFQGTFPKATGGSTAIAAGVLVYWTGTVINTTAADNTLAGKCVKAAADGDTSVECVLTTV